jgi:N-acetylmuramoyl-L-alanine amidase
LYRHLQMKLRRKSVRRKAVRFGLLASNMAVLAIVAGIVVQNQQSPTATTQVAALAGTVPAAESSNPLDQVSSADIALTVARMGGLPETTAVTNQAQSQAADMAIAAVSENVVPQIVETALKSSVDIADYTAVAGDTITTIATKFGVTSDSVRWSNSLTGDTVAAGTKLRIPPVNGVVYTVNSGDTIDSLAAKFHASKEKIIAYNDAEIKGVAVGQRIIIPDGIQQAPVANMRATTGVATAAWGIKPVYGMNGYDYGYCTWYVASRINVPSNWGNANTWAYYAPSAGWSVSKRPVVGAVGQTTGGAYGHVAVVEAVSDDGTMVKYSDMNGLSGWGRVGTTANWVPASKFNNYIYR